MVIRRGRSKEEIFEPPKHRAEVEKIRRKNRKEHEAYLLYREGRISRAEWSRILMHGFDLDSYTPKLPWWKRIFKGRSFA